MIEAKDELLADYYDEWIKSVKKGLVRPVTYVKYELTGRMIRKYAPGLMITDVNRRTYQRLINDYAADHEHATTRDFHHNIHPVLLDAMDEGLIDRDPTARIQIGGRVPGPKKAKYLEEDEAEKLLGVLDLGDTISFDYLVLMLLKTGLRFAEALGLTPADFDFEKQTITVNKTWDYKDGTGFQPTKNKSSNRTISLDDDTAARFKQLIKDMPMDRPVLVQPGERIYAAPANAKLAALCKRAGIPVITIHGLRHTHASLLISHGISIQAVAKRLGHANTVTTQNTYIHLLRRSEDEANDRINQLMRNL